MDHFSHSHRKKHFFILNGKTILKPFSRLSLAKIATSRHKKSLNGTTDKKRHYVFLLVQIHLLLLSLHSSRFF